MSDKSSSPPDEKCGPLDETVAISPDCITITDVGLGLKSQAWYWLMLGHHVYDYRFRELSIFDLERSIDPSGVMNPILLRGALWKTVPKRFWQVKGATEGLVPAQPGLGADFRGSLFQHSLYLCFTTDRS
jgi:hypothetical protein